MQRPIKAFTLVELLVVLAIVLILAGLLFPVFSSAKASARRATCISQFRQAALATSLYTGDYEDKMVLVSYQPGSPNSLTDRTWVQLILPYLRNFSIFRCPSDFGKRPSQDATFDQDLVPGDTDSRYYTASKRSNLGYNYLYLAPAYMDRNERWWTVSRGMNEVASPSKTILFVDSVWDVTPNGVPFGGGSWLVLPPCRYANKDDQQIDTFGVDNSQRLMTRNNANGWHTGRRSANSFGFAWPWHEGRMTVIRLDGHASSVTPAQLAGGCDLKSQWAGSIRDRELYDWDLD